MMSGNEYELEQKQHIERICADHFGIGLRVRSLVASDIETQDNSYATVFDTGAAMYVLYETDRPLCLRDIKSLIRLMGMEGEHYYPPAGDSNYFRRYGKEAFLSVFPGREIMTDDDTKFYEMLAPYSPALVRIAKVNGEIRRFNARGNAWQAVKNLSYARMQVQQL